MNGCSCNNPIMESEGNCIRLLIVDDEEGMVSMLTRLMEPLCSKIESTDNLKAALDMAEKRRYNLIILDLRLNGTGKKDALEAIKRLKDYHSGVVVVSGLPDDNLRGEVMAAGADAFVPKGSDMRLQSLLLAAHIATMQLPPDSPRSDTFNQHVQMLSKMAAA